MAHSPQTHDRGTRFTNYSSIHSADAFVGDYQVMYTPGSTSPQFNKATRKPSRFSRTVSSSRPQNINQSYLLPSNMPNTSQIMPDQGILPNLQVHYNIPADEKQIVASLRSLQRDLSEAMETIQELTRERDEAQHELRLLRATSRKPSSPAKKQNIAGRVEEELFDLSRSEDSPRRSASRQPSQKKVAIEKQNTISDNARVLSTVPVNTASVKQSDRRSSSKSIATEQMKTKKFAIDETEQSIAVDNDPTAASNTSRRRRRPSVDDNMTSAYILPDITEQEQPQVSKAAQNVLHSLEPEHVANCTVCRRLTTVTKSTSRAQKPTQVGVQQTQQQQSHHHQTARIDYTAQVAGFPIDDSFAQDPTMRPKVHPSQALARVRTLMNAQFLKAKERHHEAWIKYDGFEAPLSSRKHAQIGKEMRHWAEKMEECRVHLDYLRDVEEGMEESS